jgi:hypothetical protein
MSGPKRTQTERENNLELIAASYLRGKRQSDIAKEIGIDQSQVSRDLKIIHKRWRESALVNINEAKHRELAKIDLLEQTYYDAWQRSMNEITKTTTSKSDKDGSRASIVKEQRVGDSSYLAGVQWCIEQRCKIFGLYEAAKISIDWRKAVEDSGHNAGDVFEKMIHAYTAALNGNAK